MYIIWLIKLILAHLLTDFLLQPKTWVESRSKKHFASVHLYLHGLITALVALLFIGIHYWWVVLIILVTHIAIDGWKSYRPNKTKYFLIDQCLHLFVILVCWYFIFLNVDDIVSAWELINTKSILIFVTAYVFVTFPAGILIGQLTKKWRDQIPDAPTLGNAGKWIGIIERIIILTLVFNHQYAAMGLLITAKSLLRFSEANRAEIKTEYLLIGTLISITLAILVGLIALKLQSFDF
ncbi:MAG TPA: DUF3307 domain-containing protein [Flavisolibacter sp.]|jgi:hypothetical protein|nr:DUF3307 domain-containing protein [Flavisolibacter sp.]